MKRLIPFLLIMIVVPLLVAARPHGGTKKTVELLLEGDFKGVDERVKSLQPAEAKFVLGYVKYKMGRYKEAKAYFEGALEGIDLIEDHAKYFLGESCLAIDDYECAAKYLNEVIANYPHSIWRTGALWGLARLSFGEGRYGDALDFLLRTGRAGSIEFTEAEYDLFKARVLERLGRAEEAARILKGVYLAAESKDAIDEALGRLKSMGRPLELEFLDNLKDVPALADAYFRARDYEKAKHLYKKLEPNLGNLIRLAQAAARTDDFDTAIGTYQKVLEQYPGSLYRYKLGFLYMDSGEYAKAREVFQELLAGYKGSLRKKIIWDIAWCSYKLGLLDEAVGYFERVLKGGFGKDYELKALYWKARCLEAIHSDAGAIAIWKELVLKDRFGYYGFLASERLYGKKAVPPEWMSYSDSPAPRAKAGSRPPAALKKAIYLSDLDLGELAFLEARGLRGTDLVAGDIVSSVEFANKVGDYRSPHLAALRYKKLLDRFPSGDGMRRFVWELWYPRAYPDLVKKLVEASGLDENIPFSIMREESRFQTDVISRAYAIGLMQLLPSTAARLAKETGLKPFRVSDLYRPRVNVSLGIRYLSDLLDMFDGEKAYVIASYNAGEEAVGRWVRHSDAKGLDEFIEEIPYDETNDYVKRVLGTYWVYEELYK